MNRLASFFIPETAARWREEARRKELAKDELKLLRTYALIFKIKERDFVAASRIVLDDRNNARTKDPEGFLPLHLTVMNRGSERLIGLLIDAYPAALRERDPNNMLPLHIVARDNTCLKCIVDLIVSWNEGAVKLTDPIGDLPLHASLRYRCPKEISLAYLDVYPGAIEVVDKDGNLPLHMSLRFGSDEDFVEVLLARYPDAIKARNKRSLQHTHTHTHTLNSINKQTNLHTHTHTHTHIHTYIHRGDLPIHRACLFMKSLSLLQLLVRTWPESMFEKDAQGNLPIHLYYMQLRGGRPHEDVLHFFLEPYPNCIGVKNKKGSTPLQVLERYFEQIEAYAY